MADRIGASQAHVSRVEAGQAVPTLPQVQAWAEAAAVPDDERPALTALTVAALNEVDSWQQRDTADLAAMQRDVAGLEAAATTSHHFQPAMVPGMLQTPFLTTPGTSWPSPTSAAGAIMRRRSRPAWNGRKLSTGPVDAGSSC